MATNEISTQSFNAISGSDMHCMFGNYKFASLQSIRYASTREKGFVYSVGSPSPRATVRGKRSVSGAFIFSMIDRKGLVEAMNSAGGNTGKIFLSSDEQANFANSANNPIALTTKEQREAFTAGGSITTAGIVGGGAFSNFVEESVFKASNFGSEVSAYVSDQLLPFDITVVGIPEYGAKYARRLVIHGVEITTEASGTSIDDLVVEKQQSFIARGISDWVGLGQISGETGTGASNWSN